MPTYEYRCEACGEATEIFQRITEPPKRKCPACGKLRLKRLIGGGAGFLFKGSGFYITDYRSEGYKAKAKAEAEASSGKKESSAGGESKPSKPSESASPKKGEVSSGSSGSGG